MNATVDQGYTLEYSSAGGILRAYVTGERDTFAVSMAWWAALAAEARRVRPARLLIVEKFDNNLPIGELSELIDAIARLDFAGALLAYVDLAPCTPHHHDLSETMAINRGMAGRVFPDEETAKAWLLAERPA